MRLPIPAALAFTLALVACSDDGSSLQCNAASDTTPAIGESFNLRVGETATVQGSDLKLRVAEIFDSRCPRGVECGIPGAAMVRATAWVTPTEPVALQLYTPDLPNNALYLDYVIELLGVEPYPEGQQPLPQSAYCAQFKVSLGSLAGKLVYVDALSGADRLYTADGNTASNPHELAIGAIAIRPPHDAGAANLTAVQIAGLGPPVWSPGGSQLAVVARRANDLSQLIIVDAATGSAYTASPQNGRVRDPDWSPDGARLLYELSDADGADPRLAITTLASGAVEELQWTHNLAFDAYRWDEQSSGIFFDRWTVETFKSETVHRDLVTGAETVVHEWRHHPILDLSRKGGELITTPNGEGGNGLAFHETPDRIASVSAYQWPYTGPFAGPSDFSGWFLSAPDLIAVERFRGDERYPPLIGRPNPRSQGVHTQYLEYPVAVPVAFKWDFYRPAAVP